jgi:hypothetical protein
MHEIETNKLPFTRDKFTAPSWYLEMIGLGKADAA